MKRISLSLALLALLLYGPRILLPVLHVDNLGRSCDTSILEGATLLLGEGEFFLGAVVWLSAVVLPPLKLLTLLWLAASPTGFAQPGWRFRTLEVIGRFGCLEVFLTAILIASISGHEFDLSVKPGRK